MINRSTMLSVAVAAIALAACGGDDEDTAAPSDPTTTESSPETTADTPTETTADTLPETTADEAGDGGGEGCDQALTADELESIFGTPVEINGSGQVCTLIFAEDSVGTLQAFSGSKADEALDVNLTKFDGGSDLLLEDGRGYADEDGVVVRGDSGQVFVLGIPDNVAVADKQATAQAIADLLLTR